MGDATGEFELTLDELRVVARFAAESARDLLPKFERKRPDDPRPRAALDAAWEFINGGRRTNGLRTASFDAHRAAKEAPDEVTRLAAQSAGDAASAAYLHPIAKAHQVGHILRASANVARIAEIEADNDPDITYATLEQLRKRATPMLIDVLRRYPPAPKGSSRAANLMAVLDAALRS